MHQIYARRRVWSPHGVFGALVIGANVLGVGFLTVAVWIGVSYWAMFHTALDHDHVADVRPLWSLIDASLPTGSTIGRVRAVLRSHDVVALIASRGFGPLAPDTSFHSVPSFDRALDESEVYPRGTVLFAGAWNAGNGVVWSERYLTVRLFFDAAGRFTRYAVDESVAMM